MTEPDNAQIIAEMALTYEAMQMPDKRVRAMAARSTTRARGSGRSTTSRIPGCTPCRQRQTSRPPGNMRCCHRERAPPPRTAHFQGQPGTRCSRSRTSSKEDLEDPAAEQKIAFEDRGEEPPRHGDRSGQGQNPGVLLRPRGRQEHRPRRTRRRNTRGSRPVRSTGPTTNLRCCKRPTPGSNRPPVPAAPVETPAARRGGRHGKGRGVRSHPGPSGGPDSSTGEDLRGVLRTTLLQRPTPRRAGRPRPALAAVPGPPHPAGGMILRASCGCLRV